MYLLGCGINHKSATIAIREQLAFDQQQASSALHSLLQRQAANEAVLLSTCNRTEIYAFSHQPERIKEWLFSQCNSELDLTPFCYEFVNADCVKHLLRVASGLDSMLLGEPQIMGQIKQAYQLACQAGAVGTELKQLFPAIFSASKQIRQNSNLGAHSVSLAYSIIQLSKRIFSQIQQCRVLLLGAGTQMELITTYLIKQGIKHFIIANRHLEKAQKLANTIAAQAIQLSDIPAYLPQVDLVICATSSPLPLIGKGMVERAIKQRRHSPMLMCDLAVPRDIEPEVADLDDIYLYNIDDFQEIIDANQHHRQLAAKQAEMLVDAHTEIFMRKLRIHQSRHVISQFRKQMDLLREKEVKKALQNLQNGQDPKLIISELAHKLTNKILHQPTIKLRHAASEQQLQILQLMQELL